MLITIALVSIFAIAGLAGLLRRAGFAVCPICAGVAGTWLWMLSASFLGYAIDIRIPAMLMGGSVVGIAYTAEKRISGKRSPLIWKMLFIPIGFAAAYALLSQLWIMFAGAVIALAAIAFAFLGRADRPPANESRVKEIEKKMEQCC